MEKKNVCDFGDILSHAETLGYTWNGAHELLDRIYPYHGAMDIYVDEITEEEDYNEDTIKIVHSFAKHHGVTEFQINPKGG